MAIFEVGQIGSIEDLHGRVKDAKLRLKCDRIWFRGHGDQAWTLDAPIFRKRVGEEFPATFEQIREQEREIANTFKQRAPLRRLAFALPNDDAYFGWLTLMRHYGARCRLLDWTESALVALYFAVEDANDGNDGALWFLEPNTLNDRASPGYKSGQVLKMVRPVSPEFTTVQNVSRAAFYGEPDRTQWPIAVVPTETSNRMLVQSSVFTMQSHEDELIGLRDQSVIQSARIPKDKKQHLRELLNQCGINRYQLFPDLEDLATWLNDTVIGKA